MYYILTEVKYSTMQKSKTKLKNCEADLVSIQWAIKLNSTDSSTKMCWPSERDKVGDCSKENSMEDPCKLMIIQESMFA